MLNVLSIDPSLRSTGYAIRTPTPSGGHRWHHGTLTPRRRHNGRWHKLDDPERLLWITAQTHTLAVHHNAQLVAIEGPSYASKSSSTDRIGAMHWMIRSKLWATHIPYLIVPPTTIKLYACGNGGPATDKHAMRDACHRLLGLRPDTHDEADALLLAALVAHACGQPIIDPADLPARAAEAVATVGDHLARAR